MVDLSINIDAKAVNDTKAKIQAYGLTDAGELSNLKSAGIASLNTSYTDVFGIDAQGNIHGEHSSAALTDGRTIDMVDVYFQVQS